MSTRLHSGQWLRATMSMVAMMALPLTLAAQDGGGVLTISLDGDRSTRADVLLSSGTTRESLGRVTGGDPLELAMAAVNIGKGRRVAVNVTGNSVVLVPEGTVDARCADAEVTRSEDECRRVAMVTWGESASVDLAWQGGALTGLGINHVQRFRFGADYAIAKFSRLDEVACSDAIEGLTSCAFDDKGRGIGVYAEYGVTPWLGVGARYSRSGYQVMQQFGGTAVDHDVSVSMFDIYSRVEWPNGPVRPWGIMGASWFDNEDEIDNGEEIRSESGLRLLLGGGLDWHAHDRFGVRAGFRYGSGGSDDADTHWGPVVGAHFNF